MSAKVGQARFKMILAVLVGAELLASLESAMIYTAMPTIMREFNNIEASGWLLSSYLLVMAVSAAIGGRLGDIFGRRNVLLVVLGICSVGSLISAVGPSIIWVIIGRTIQGMCGAILPLCFGLARQAAPEGRLQVAVGILAGAYSASGAVGFVLGGYLAEKFDWHAIFYVTTVFPIVLAPFVYFILPDSKCDTRVSSIDWLGGVLFVPGIAGLLLAVTLAKTWGVFSVEILSLTLGSFAFLVAWIRHELRHENPLIDVSLLLNKSLALGNTCSFLLGFGSFQLPLVVILLFQQPLWTGVGLGLGATVSGILKLPSNVVALAGGPLGGKIAKIRSERTALLLGGGVCAIGWFGILLFHSSTSFIVMMTVLIGFGQAMVLAGVANIILANAPEQRASEATGLGQVIRLTGTSIGAQVASVVLASSVVISANGASFPSADAYNIALILIFLSTTSLVVVASLIPRKQFSRST